MQSRTKKECMAEQVVRCKFLLGAADLIWLSMLFLEKDILVLDGFDSIRLELIEAFAICGWFKPLVLKSGVIKWCSKCKLCFLDFQQLFADFSRFSKTLLFKINLKTVKAGIELVTLCDVCLEQILYW